MKCSHFYPICLVLVLIMNLFLWLSCSPPADVVLQLQDARSGNPVEGALVWAPSERMTFRSDVNGRVKVPGIYTDGILKIRAKNCWPLEINGAALPDVPLQLVYDESLANPAEAALVFTRGDTLRGAYGPYRANNDLISYDLTVRLDVAEKYLVGNNVITFKMLQDGRRIQLDLFDNMAVDSILYQGKPLAYTRDFNAVFVDFPEMLPAGKAVEIDFHYSGHPRETGRFGGIAFKEDSLGNPWIYTACQGIGASLWWPNKDQKPDEPDSMRMRVIVPAELTDVSNGRFLGRSELGDGYAAYDWQIHYPINNYSVSLNIGKYVHFADSLGDLSLDYYVLPYHLEAARRQFSQAKPMLECFEKYFGPYPFPKDGYKLIEVPYSGMEHQSAVTYGNLFRNGYLGRDWTGVGISTQFDFIIVHESGHEWFGNSVTANDDSDAWLQEGWCTYTEAVYVECRFGYEDALAYLNGYQSKVRNRAPVIGPPGVNHWPTGDIYFKGALFLNTLRSVVNDDAVWWPLVYDYAEHFKYRNIFTSDMINFFNRRLERDLTPLFLQYLYRAELPVLELDFREDALAYRWNCAVTEFDMPVEIRTPQGVKRLHPRSEWQTIPADSTAQDNWEVATERFFLEVAEK